jgi:hypothetical protein
MVNAACGSAGGQVARLSGVLAAQLNDRLQPAPFITLNKRRISVKYMNREQRTFLLGRLYNLPRVKIKEVEPMQVAAARRIIGAYERGRDKREDRARADVDLSVLRAKEVIYGGDYAKALSAVKAIERLNKSMRTRRT